MYVTLCHVNTWFGMSRATLLSPFQLVHTLFLMLHELIFVLSGFPSDVFIPFPSDNPCTFSINPEFPLLHPAERESLNRLGHLGWIYAKLNMFSVKQGAYAQAMATALEATLEEYRRDILEMEQLVLDKTYDAGAGVVPISLLASSLGRWELLLPALLEFTCKFDACDYYGCKLLDLVLDEARTGNKDYRDVMHKVADRLHDVLYRQITSWMVYGNWTNDEFFITKSSSNSTMDSPAGWQRRYGLALEQIPKHIPLALAESVLFVGKAVATVNQMGNNPMPDTMKRDHLQLLLSLRQGQSRQYDPLKHVVQQIRRSTADWLFSCVLTGEHSLQCYLESFRHMFLLGYGDLASNFITACTEWRRRSLAKYPQDQHYKTTMIFRHQEFNALLAKASVGTEAEDQMDGYGVEIMQNNDDTSGSLFSRLLLVDLSCTLRYDMRWPIDLFLSKEDLQCYSDLWTFMTGLRNVQMSLSDLWISLRHGPSSHEARAICRLRSYMLFWVDTLWNHIQVDVYKIYHGMSHSHPSILVQCHQSTLPTTHPNHDWCKTTFHFQAS